MASRIMSGMFRGHPNVIGSFLRIWEGANGLTRWYYNKWECFLSDGQIRDYRSEFGTDLTDPDSGIRVFFDDRGYLHIDNCRDPDLKTFLEYRMMNWYQWAKEEYRVKQGYPPMNVLELIEPYTRELKPGFHQTRFEDMVFNFDEETRFMMSERYLPFDHSWPGYIVNTGFPRLDSILKAIIRHGECPFPPVKGSLGVFWRRSHS